MNHETLEQAARQFGEDVGDQYMAPHAFKAGASWREQQASEGFYDYAESKRGRDAFNPCDNDWSIGEVAEAWQASALHSAKLLAEKDAEIEKLRKERLELLEYKFMYEQLCK